MPKRWVFGLATAAVAVIALWLVTLKPAHDAKMFLREFTALSPQAVSIEEITSLYNRYGGKLIEDTQTPTTILEVKFENRVLAGLRIAPPTALIVSTVISSEKIDYSHAALRIQTSKTSPGVSVTDFLHVEDQPPISIQAIRRPEGPPREAYIKITDRLLPATRRKVFAFNTGCLSWWRGCQTINDFLPTFPELEHTQIGE